MKQNVQLYQSLADETRLRILALLLSEGELCVCDIISALKVPQPKISRHLARLRKAGWVNDRRCGLWVYYSIAAGEQAHQELLPVLKKQILASRVSVADRETLTGFGTYNRCA